MRSIQSPYALSAQDIRMLNYNICRYKAGRMEINKQQFKKRFPRLAQEMEEGESKVSMTSIRSDTEAGEKAVSEEFEGYNPDVIDFLRRCDNEEQAEEVIRFLLKQKEISRDYASRLRRQLRRKGVRSFGSKKEGDYYVRQAGL